jgi:hypothetical protein
VLTTALLTAASASAQSYTIGAIEAEGVTDIIPYAVNNHTVVVGYATFGDHLGGFRWEDGTLIELELPAGATTGVALDINDDGVIVGQVVYPASCFPGHTQGVFWIADEFDSSVTLLDYNVDHPDLPEEAACDIGSYPYGISADGLILGGAGYTKDKGGGVFDQKISPVTTADGTWTELIEPRIPPFDQVRVSGWGLAANDDGLVLGIANFGPDRAFITYGGEYTVLEIHPGSHGKGLNNLGHVAGRSAYVDSLTPEVARIWDGEEYIDLDDRDSQILAINDSDIAVGRRTSNFSGPLSRGTGMLYRPGYPPASLSALAGIGWSIRSANDINEAGTIVGVGATVDGQTAFWMAPQGIGYSLSGTVDDDGAPVSGATVKVSRIIGDSEEPLDDLTTDTNGEYSTNLSGGDYLVWVEPQDEFAPVEDAPCVQRDYFCQVELDRPRVVDFRSTSAAPLCGDATGDGVLTAADALLALQAAVGSAVCALSACDISGDGQLTSVDALLILAKAVGLGVAEACPLS